VWSTSLGTVIFWSFLLNWLGFRFPEFQRVINPPPLLLVKNGRLIKRHLERELITEDELMSKLRQQGVEFVHEVKFAYLEADGSISIIPTESQANSTIE
jgi:uncharacterized membrane protein YcaP (DUF421 family)